MGRPLHYSQEVLIAAAALCGLLFSTVHLQKLPLFSWPDFNRVLFSPIESSPRESPQRARLYIDTNLKNVQRAAQKINGTHVTVPMDVNNKQTNEARVKGLNPC